MTEHFKTLCKCGILIGQCRCPAEYKRVDVPATCEHDWPTALEDELSEEYDVPANVSGRVVEVELPATRQWLEVALTNVNGFVVTLNIGDETGGVLKSVDLYSCVKRENLADTVSNIYNSY